MMDETLRALLQFRQLPRKAKLLGILALEERRPKGQREIRSIARTLGLVEVRRWRLSELCAQLEHEVRLSRDGWQLTAAGFNYVNRIPQLLREIHADETSSAASPQRS